MRDETMHTTGTAGGAGGASDHHATQPDFFHNEVHESVLGEAERIIGGDRQTAYGPARRSFERIADLWTAVLADKLRPDKVVAARDVGLLMIALKLSREVSKHGRDNLVDIAGYAALTNDMVEPGGPR